jgi:hypothetical protein
MYCVVAMDFVLSVLVSTVQHLSLGDTSVLDLCEVIHVRPQFRSRNNDDAVVPLSEGKQRGSSNLRNTP